MNTLYPSNYLYLVIVKIIDLVIREHKVIEFLIKLQNR